MGRIKRKTCPKCDKYCRNLYTYKGKLNFMCWRCYRTGWKNDEKVKFSKIRLEMKRSVGGLWTTLNQERVNEHKRNYDKKKKLKKMEEIK